MKRIINHLLIGSDPPDRSAVDAIYDSIDREGTVSIVANNEDQRKEVSRELSSRCSTFEKRGEDTHYFGSEEGLEWSVIVKGKTRRSR